MVFAGRMKRRLPILFVWKAEGKESMHGVEALPKDPYILLSYINTKLRDEYPTLGALCEDRGLEVEELRERLKAVGYDYDAVENQFKTRI